MSVCLIALSVHMTAQRHTLHTSINGKDEFVTEKDLHCQNAVPVCSLPTIALFCSEVYSRIVCPFPLSALL